jgi:hypothetical protein
MGKVHCVSTYLILPVCVYLNVHLIRPVRYYSDGTMSLRAASGFRNVPGLKGPQCPHAANPFRLKEDTEMVLRKKAHAGKTLYYYQVPPLSHICTFVGMSILLVLLTEYLLTYVQSSFPHSHAILIHI